MLTILKLETRSFGKTFVLSNKNGPSQFSLIYQVSVTKLLLCKIKRTRKIEDIFGLSYEC